MNVLDIIIGMVVLWAVISGFREGIIVQLCGLAGVLIGVWAAFRFSNKVGEWFGYDNIPPALSFIILLAASILILVLVGHLTRGLVRMTGLGFVDRLGGIFLSIVKFGLVLSLAINFFIYMNRTAEFVDERKIESSVLLRPLEMISGAVFPYIKNVTNLILDNVNADGKSEEKEPAENESLKSA